MWCHTQRHGPPSTRYHVSAARLLRCDALLRGRHRHRSGEGGLRSSLISRAFPAISVLQLTLVIDLFSAQALRQRAVGSSHYYWARNFLALTVIEAPESERISGIAG